MVGAEDLPPGVEPFEGEEDIISLTLGEKSVPLCLQSLKRPACLYSGDCKHESNIALFFTHCPATSKNSADKIIEAGQPGSKFPFARISPNGNSSDGEMVIAFGVESINCT